MKGIIILGMRAGTSALTRCFNICDLSLGINVETLPRKGNLTGQFENTTIKHFNSTILEELRTNWNDIDLINRLKTLDANKYINTLKDIINQEFNNNNIFVLKDPRISLLLPLYTKLDIDLKFIYPIRDINHIASSLHKRDNMDLDYALRLAKIWNTIITQSNTPLITFSFKEIIDYPISLIKELIKVLDIHLVIKEKEILEFINPKLVNF